MFCTVWLLYCMCIESQLSIFSQLFIINWQKCLQRKYACICTVCNDLDHKSIKETKAQNILGADLICKKIGYQSLWFTFNHIQYNEFTTQRAPLLSENAISLLFLPSSWLQYHLIPEHQLGMLLKMAKNLPSATLCDVMWLCAFQNHLKIKSPPKSKALDAKQF